MILSSVQIAHQANLRTMLSTSALHRALQVTHPMLKVHSRKRSSLIVRNALQEDLPITRIKGAPTHARVAQ